ncbi:MAG: hypothetical protein H6696_05130 [Deferribacteres bacterium]|nr:hypothetical protein [Deferribacteres bacterium]
MRKYGILYLLLFLLTLGCTKNDASSNKTTQLLPEINGWKISETPKVYTEANLFDYINGNSELYFPYGFVQLVSTSYENSSRSDQTIVIDIYDMGSALGAYGVYSSMTHPDYTYGEIGCESIQSSQQLRFWQDRYQIEMNCPSPFDGAEEFMQNVAMSLSKNIPACIQPEQLSWLPKENQLDHSQKYIADGFLGLNELPGGIEAGYSLNESNVKGFAVKCATETDAQKYLEIYRDSQKTFKGVDLQDNGTSFTSFYKYGGYVWAGIDGNWLYGATATENPENCQAVAEAIQHHLPHQN